MNIGMVQRAIRRHKQMKNRPAYAAFLEHVASRKDVWKVPQRDIIAWWQRRQTAALELAVLSRGTLRVSCSLPDCVVEVDGSELRIPPFETEVPSTLPKGVVGLSCGCDGLPKELLRELLGHLGYGHMAPGSVGQPVVIHADQLRPLLGRLKSEAMELQRFGANEIKALRSLFVRAHHQRGIPDLRLWSLPRNGDRAYRSAVSARYDVDKAIVNLPAIHELEAKYDLRSTVYLRPMGFFYGPGEIHRYMRITQGQEIALHGEFVTTAETRFGDQFAAAEGEKKYLEDLIGEEVAGVCMHGGELRTNTTEQTRDAIEDANFKYETMYRNDYYLPLHLPTESGVRRTLSLGQHFADITAEPDSRFPEKLAQAFVDCFSQAEVQGGVFVPVMHPLYFDIPNYLRYPTNLLHLAAFMPKFFWTAARMRRGQQYANPDQP
jgi:hypothetical protein